MLNSGTATINYFSLFTWGTIFCIGLWLLIAGLAVEIEYYDGFEAVSNSCYLLGTFNEYSRCRSPLLSFYLIPAQLIKQALQLPPLDLRVHHWQMALTHFVYLVAVLACLCKLWGKKLEVALAFFATVCCYIFFSYAPFLSHDIFPGLLLLLMLMGSEEFRRRPSLSGWIWLVIMGAAAALIKQTYAIFWIAILLGHLLLAWKEKDGPIRSCLYLAAGAIISGIITWLVIGWVLAGSFPESHLLLRPYRQVIAVFNQYKGSKDFSPWWVYWRNYPMAYGVSTALLVIPGAVLAWRNDRLGRLVVIVWGVCLLTMQSLHMKEVRYLAYLIPLNAFLLVPALEKLRRHRGLFVLLIPLLAWDFANAAREASWITDKFYLKSELRQFLQPLEADTGKPQMVVMFNFLSFTPHGNDHFPGDPFHRLFHFGPHHLRCLYHQKLLWRRHESELVSNAVYKNGVLLLYAKGMLMHRIEPGPYPVATTDYRQYAALSASNLLKNTGGHYWLAGDDDPAIFQSEALADKPTVTLTCRRLPALLRFSMFPRLINGKNGRIYELRRILNWKYAVLGMEKLPQGQPLYLCRFNIIHYKSIPAAAFRINLPPPEKKPSKTKQP